MIACSIRECAARYVFGSLPIFFPLVVPPTSIGRRGHERIYTVAFGPMCLSACSACTSHLAATRNAQSENGSGLGRWRWVIERTFAWLNRFRRRRLRYEKRADMHKALLSLACALICWNFLQG